MYPVDIVVLVVNEGVVVLSIRSGGVGVAEVAAGGMFYCLSGIDVLVKLLGLDHVCAFLGACPLRLKLIAVVNFYGLLHILHSHLLLRRFGFQSTSSW